MIDGGLIVGYLTAALLRGGRRMADKTVDAMLDRLIDLVAERIGAGPVDRLQAHPREDVIQREVGLVIDGAASGDTNFAHELAVLVAELDRRGGRQMINEVYAQINVQAFDHGVAVGGDFNYFNAPDPDDMSDAPGWVKFCIVLGWAIAVSGIFIFGYTLFTESSSANDASSSEPPAGVALAFAVFFVGFIISGIGAIGRSFSKRR